MVVELALVRCGAIDDHGLRENGAVEPTATPPQIRSPVPGVFVVVQLREDLELEVDVASVSTKLPRHAAHAAEKPLAEDFASTIHDHAAVNKTFYVIIVVERHRGAISVIWVRVGVALVVRFDYLEPPEPWVLGYRMTSKPRVEFVLTEAPAQYEVVAIGGDGLVPGQGMLGGLALSFGGRSLGTKRAIAPETVDVPGVGHLLSWNRLLVQLQVWEVVKPRRQKRSAVKTLSKVDT